MKIRFTDTTIKVVERKVKKGRWEYTVRSIGFNTTFSVDEVEAYGDKLAKIKRDGIFILYLDKNGDNLNVGRRLIETNTGVNEYIVYYKRVLLYVPKHVVEKYGYTYRKTKIVGSGIYVVRPATLAENPLDILRKIGGDLISRVWQRV